MTQGRSKSNNTSAVRESKLEEREKHLQSGPSDLEKRLAELEQQFQQQKSRADELEVENRQLRENPPEQDGGRSLNPGTRIAVGNGYRFRVEPAKKGSPLPAKEFKCCDESEAIRLYCCETQDPQRRGKQVNPSIESLRAVSLDEKDRRARWLHDRRVSRLRQRLQNGYTLTPEEMEIIEKEEERYVKEV